MLEPTPLTWEQQLDLFEQRGMIVKFDDTEKLKHISYYKLKEFAKPFSKLSNQNDKRSIVYTNIDFTEVLARFYQDKNLRIYLLHAIEKIEVSIKTKISFVLGERYGAFGYLNFSSWSNRDKFSKYKVETQQFYIKKSLLKTMKKSQLSELKNRHNIENDGFPSVWLGIDLLMFGNIVTILESMSEKNLRLIALEYNCSTEELVSWMKCLHFVRNICAHNSKLIDIKLTTKPKVRSDWMDYFDNLYLKGAIVKPSNKLAVVITIIIYLVNQINNKYQFSNIQSSINTLCKDDNRATLLGFKDRNSARHIVENIKEKKRHP